MIQTFIHTSENRNTYIYDDQSRLSMLVHPEFEKAHKKLPDSTPYYLKKHAYLRNLGFFSKPKRTDFISLDESVVRDNIINTPQIVFETTGSCNLNCTYCGLGKLYEGDDKRTSKKINKNYAISLLKYVFDLKPKNSRLIITFYGGEALLNIDFIKQMVETAQQLNIEKGLKLEYSMTTNATLLHKYIDFLVMNKFILLISLDGNEINHSYRVFKKGNKNSFQRVIENLDMIKNKYPEYFSTYVSFNAVLHNRNSVSEIYEFIYSRYSKVPRISELNMRDIKAENKDVLKKMHHSKRVSEAEYQKDEHDLSLITHNELSLYVDLTNFLKFCSVNYYLSNVNAFFHTREMKLPTGTCTPFNRKIFLTNRNQLLTCEKINYKYYLGEINKDIDIEIKKITKQYNFYYEHIKNKCRTCYSYRFCGTCLFHLENIVNIDKKEFVCENFCNKDDFKYRLNRTFSFLEKHPSDFAQILENVIIE